MERAGRESGGTESPPALSQPSAHSSLQPPSKSSRSLAARALARARRLARAVGAAAVGAVGALAAGLVAAAAGRLAVARRLAGAVGAAAAGLVLALARHLCVFGWWGGGGVGGAVVVVVFWGGWGEGEEEVSVSRRRRRLERGPASSSVVGGSLVEFRSRARSFRAWAPPLARRVDVGARFYAHALPAWGGARQAGARARERGRGAANPKWPPVLRNPCLSSRDAPRFSTTPCSPAQARSAMRRRLVRARPRGARGSRGLARGGERREHSRGEREGRDKKKALLFNNSSVTRARRHGLTFRGWGCLACVCVLTL